MAFKKFDESGTGRGRPTGTEPMVSLRKSTSIGVNGAAIEEFFGDQTGAVLYYDEEDYQIGIEPVADTEADEAAYSISLTDSGGTIAPKTFLEQYNLVPDVTTHFTPEWNDEDDQELVVVDLDDPTGTYGSPDDGKTDM